eukprot:CAMPEP_0170748180 /NCGR_PEP_ID=MMETSP0437-20130122/9713_1 /TAXON_ID=0 /ORGANISM="Sexangularia sp." /LENGTH=210 /DNA_ID=CAMNT_0011086997 /DNA_START=14 /DNA_END=643 /DNA_ORIENTATION=-
MSTLLEVSDDFRAFLLKVESGEAPDVTEMDKRDAGKLLSELNAASPRVNHVSADFAIMVKSFLGINGNMSGAEILKTLESKEEEGDLIITRRFHQHNAVTKRDFLLTIDETINMLTTTAFGGPEVLSGLRILKNVGYERLMSSTHSSNYEFKVYRKNNDRCDVFVLKYHFGQHKKERRFRFSLLGGAERNANDTFLEILKAEVGLSESRM